MALDTPFVDGKIKGMSGGSSDSMKSKGKAVGKKMAKMSSGKMKGK